MCKISLDHSQNVAKVQGWVCKLPRATHLPFHKECCPIKNSWRHNPWSGFLLIISTLSLSGWSYHLLAHTESFKSWFMTSTDSLRSNQFSLKLSIYDSWLSILFLQKSQWQGALFCQASLSHHHNKVVIPEPHQDKHWAAPALVSWQLGHVTDREGEDSGKFWCCLGEGGGGFQQHQCMPGSYLVFFWARW